MSLAEAITRRRGGDWHGSWGSFATPGHSPRDRGCTVRDAPGAPDNVLYHSFNGADPLALKDEDRRAGILPAFNGSQRRPTVVDHAAAEKARKARDLHRQAMRKLALEVAKETQPLWGTLVEPYLREQRGVDIPADADRVLRFHPACMFGEGVRLPSMVAIMRNPITGKFSGIHRTAIDKDGGKVGRKMLGDPGAIMLTHSADVTSGLGICEGVEDGLALLQAGFAPVWAMATAGGIKRLPALPGIEALTIFADHDDAGIDAGRHCARQWADAGKEVALRIPDTPGADWADTWRHR
ncbi:DUF7146 domain-containing protein [Pacificimonas sp. ICDLI1SI03]